MRVRVLTFSLFIRHQINCFIKLDLMSIQRTGVGSTVLRLSATLDNRLDVNKISERRQSNCVFNTKSTERKNCPQSAVIGFTMRSVRKHFDSRFIGQFVVAWNEIEVIGWTWDSSWSSSAIRRRTDDAVFAVARRDALVTWTFFRSSGARTVIAADFSICEKSVKLVGIASAVLRRSGCHRQRVQLPRRLRKREKSRECWVRSYSELVDFLKEVRLEGDPNSVCLRFNVSWKWDGDSSKHTLRDVLFIGRQRQLKI